MRLLTIIVLITLMTFNWAHSQSDVLLNDLEALEQDIRVKDAQSVKKFEEAKKAEAKASFLAMRKSQLETELKKLDTQKQFEIDKLPKVNCRCITGFDFCIGGGHPARYPSDSFKALSLTEKQIRIQKYEALVINGGKTKKLYQILMM